MTIREEVRGAITSRLVLILSGEEMMYNAYAYALSPYQLESDGVDSYQ